MVEPKGWGDNANMVTLGICNKGYKKEHIWVYYLEKWQCVQIWGGTTCPWKSTKRVGDKIHKQWFYLVICFTLV